MAVQQVRMLREADLTEIQKFTLFASCAFDARSMALVRVLVMRSFPEAATSHSALDAQDEGVEQRARLVVGRLCLLALEVSPPHSPSLSPSVFLHVSYPLPLPPSALCLRVSSSPSFLSLSFSLYIVNLLLI
jgi:hypothetical protein